MRSIEHFNNGSRVADGARQGDVWNPSQGEVQAKVNLGTAATLQKAVDAARAARPAWAMTNPQRRARIMFKFKDLVEAHMDELAELLASDMGKVIADAEGDVQRGLEVIEFCCGIPLCAERRIYNRRRPGIDVYSMRQPLGIGCGITPFNFPAMIPMWMFGPAIAAGNAFVLKLSERDSFGPGAPGRADAGGGLPTASSTSSMATRKWSTRSSTMRTFAPISFVGSSDIAQYIYSRGTATGSAQAFGGAKNHGIVLPDADLDQVVNDLPVPRSAWPASAAWRCRWWCRSATTPPRAARKLVPAIEKLRVGIPDRSGGALRPGGQRGPQAAGRKLHPDAPTRAQSWWSTAAASPCRAMRRASSASTCSTV